MNGVCINVRTFLKRKKHIWLWKYLVRDFQYALYLQINKIIPSLKFKLCSRLIVFNQHFKNLASGFHYCMWLCGAQMPSVAEGAYDDNYWGLLFPVIDLNDAYCMNTSSVISWPHICITSSIFNTVTVMGFIPTITCHEMVAVAKCVFTMCEAPCSAYINLSNPPRQITKLWKLP